MRATGPLTDVDIAELRRFRIFLRALKRAKAVSIQIANPGGRAERSEVLTRLQGLCRACCAAGDAGDDTPERRAEWRAKLTNEVKAFTFALIGSYPTGEEVREVIGE
jgi:hypothetical protein